MDLRSVTRPHPNACIGAALLLGVACSTPTGAPAYSQIVATPAAQRSLARDPELALLLSPGALQLRVSLTVPDSTAQLSWTPTSARVETSTGLSREIEIVPVHCLEDIDPANDFPYRFAWTFCDHVAVVTTSVLSSARTRRLAEVLSGVVVDTHVLSGTPGAQYILRVPAGRDATTEAVRRAEMFPEVASAGVLSNEPPCVYSDQVPRPACPEWSFMRSLPVSFSGAGGDTIRVASGGWVRLTYIEVSGTQRVVQITVP